MATSDSSAAGSAVAGSASDAGGARLAKRPSLLVQLFVTNSVVLLVATLLLIVTPVRVSANPVLAEALIVAAGLLTILAIQLALLRRILAPLRRLSEVMAAIDLRRPGRRLTKAGGAAAELDTLADAFNAMVDRLEDERRDSARRALAAQEEERLRIAREMHDQIGQALTAMTIQAERAAQMDHVDRVLLRQIARTALQSLDDLRRIGRELRPEALDDLGLGNALITLCRRMSEQGGVRVTPRLEPGLPPLAREAELVVYRIAQEAITNAIRHADASHIRLIVAPRGDGVDVVVRDDGSGMPDRLPDDTAGLAGMQERARLIGAHLTFSTVPAGGTEVHLVVPAEEISAR